MKREDPVYRQFVSILNEELVPAMGCTEPIAIAYAAATARAYLGRLPEQISVAVSGNIVKNVKSVVVPHTNGLRGIEAAVAAGIVAGNAEKKLEVLSEVRPEQTERIASFLRDTPINVFLATSGLLLDIRVKLTAGEDRVNVRIVNSHTNIVFIKKNGEVLLDTPIEAHQQAVRTSREGLCMRNIFDFAETVEPEDIREVIERQIRCNMAIAEAGMQGSYGANIGATLWDTGDHSVRSRARAMAAAGSDARMNGCELPVVINSGSGNQGMTVSVPIVVYAREKGIGEERMLRALVLANLLAICQKTQIGKLSAYCGAINAGCAAGCGIAYMLGGDRDAVEHTMMNALAISSGVICDGAKASCAGKIAVAVDTGLLGYEMYLHGRNFRPGDGIVKRDADRTIRSVACLARDGMRATDEEILRIMLEADE